MNKLFQSSLSKEIILVLVIKLMLLITIKVLWFSDPQQHVQQSFTETVLGKTQAQQKKENHNVSR